MLTKSTGTNKKTESLFLTIIILLVFNIATITPADTDMWWHLRAGNDMWGQGRILLEDTFSYTRNGAPWINAFWISDVGLYGLWKLGGFYAITLAVSLIAVIVMSIIYLHMEGNVYLRGILILLAMIGIHPNWSARPQLMSFLLLAVLDYFLDRHRYVKRQHLWVLAIIFILWANLHGGFIWGILLLLATLAGEVLDNLFDNEPKLNWNEIGDLALWCAIAVLAATINPNGTSLWLLPFSQVNVSLSIAEWLSPDFHQFYPHPVLWLLFLLVISLSYSSKRMSFVDLLKSLGFIYLFFVAQRNMGPSAIILLPVISKHLISATQSFSQIKIVENAAKGFDRVNFNKQPSPRTNFIINTFLISLLTIYSLVNAYLISTAEQINKKTPSRSVQWIKENKPSGPIFNSYNWGGYLTWELRDYPVFIDGRADLYGNQMLQEWSEISSGTIEGLALLEKYKINLIYLEPYQPLLGKLDPQKWKEVYEDSQIVIFQRK
jgi:hypothetical protein